MGWRKSASGLIVWTALVVLVWFASGIGNSNCATTAVYPDACNSIVNIVLGALVVVWFLGAAAISIVWYASKQKTKRPC